jgi:hypothetical protein
MQSDSGLTKPMPSASSSTSELLAQRGTTHGDFTVNARISQRLKAVIQEEPNWPKLAAYQQEAIHMILHKISRAVAGNADFKDHWDDIAGYAKLVSDRCTS